MYLWITFSFKGYKKKEALFIYCLLLFLTTEDILQIWVQITRVTPVYHNDIGYDYPTYNSYNKYQSVHIVLEHPSPSCSIYFLWATFPMLEHDWY